MFIRGLLELKDKDVIREVHGIKPSSNYELLMEDWFICSDYINGLLIVFSLSNFTIFSKVQFDIFSGVTLELINMNN